MRYRSNPASCSIMQVSVLQLRNCIHFHLGCVAVPLFGRLWMAVFFGTAWPGGQHPELCKLVKIRNLRSSQNLGHFSVKLHSLQIWWPVSNLEVSPGKISSKSSVSESFWHWTSLHCPIEITRLKTNQIGTLLHTWITWIPFSNGLASPQLWYFRNLEPHIPNEHGHFIGTATVSQCLWATVLGLQPPASKQ